MKVQDMTALLVQLKESLTEAPVGAEAKQEIQSLLSSYRFKNDENVPDWLLSFLRAIVKRQETAQTSFEENESVEGDVFGFIHDLNKLLKVTIDDEGEMMSLDFEEISTQGIIIWMGNTYEVCVYD